MASTPVSAAAVSLVLAQDHPDTVGARLLVAISAGADSTAALYLLHDAGCELTAVHVHHGLRGAAADADAAACRDHCEALGVPLRVAHLAAPGRRPEGREATWRRLRYAALEAERRRIGADFVVTGHHRDDVAEGVLTQLVRGAGPRALAGIEAASDGRVLRPLLRWRRHELREWLAARDVRWREDHSNRDSRHLRNRVRDEAMPVLERLAPALRDHLVHLAAALARDGEALDAAVTLPVPDPWRPDGGVPAPAVASLDDAGRARWLHRAAARRQIGRVSRRQLELFGALLDSHRPRAVALAGRWRLRIAGGRLWLEPPADPPGWHIGLGPEVDRLSLPLPLPGWTLAVHPPVPTGSGADPWRRRVGVGRRLVVRPLATAGEPAPPAVATARRRLPRHLRHSWPVMLEDDRITWVPGIWQASGDTGSAAKVVEVIYT